MHAQYIPIWEYVKRYFQAFLIVLFGVSRFLGCWISVHANGRLTDFWGCVVNWALPLIFSLCCWTPQPAQAQESPKTEQPTDQEAPKPSVMRIRIGGNVAKSQLKHKVQPRYPQEARDNRIQGTVRLHVVLSTSGKVQQLDVVSGDPILAKAAAEAVRQWEYNPMLLNGEPVEVDTTVDVVFTLLH
jgi:TonB family protein